MVVPALSGLRSIGSAVPIELPDPPAVGDCVAQLSRPSGDTGGATAARGCSRRGGAVRLLPRVDRRRGGRVLAHPGGLANAPRSRRAGPAIRHGRIHGPVPDGRRDRPGDRRRGANLSRGGPPCPTRPTRPPRPTWNPNGPDGDGSACVITPSGGRDTWAACGTRTRTDRCPPCSVRAGRRTTPGCSPGRSTAPGRTPHSCWRPAGTAPGCSRRQRRGVVYPGGPPGDGGRRPGAGRPVGRRRRPDGALTRLAGNPSSIGCFVSVAGERRMTGLVNGLRDRPVPFES